MVKKLLMNILLTLVWMALTGKFSGANFLFGLVLSFSIMWIISRNDEDQRYFRRLPAIINLIFFFIYELIKANIQVAYDVITPKFYMQPGIVAIPLTVETDLEITLLANMITLTPGTCSLDVSPDKKILYVHAMYINDKESFIESIKNGFEQKILRIMR
ncbi:MAG: Na+/H+ antiporter subunit E [Flavobacteriales bacterium]